MQLLMQVHQLVLVVELVRHVEQYAHLQRRLGSFEGDLFGLLVHAEHEQTARQVGEHLGGRFALVAVEDLLELLLKRC